MEKKIPFQALFFHTKHFLYIDWSWHVVYTNLNSIKVFKNIYLKQPVNFNRISYKLQTVNQVDFCARLKEIWKLSINITYVWKWKFTVNITLNTIFPRFLTHGKKTEECKKLEEALFRIWLHQSNHSNAFGFEHQIWTSCWFYVNSCTNIHSTHAHIKMYVQYTCVAEFAVMMQRCRM